MIVFNEIIYPSGKTGFFCYLQNEPDRLLIGWLPFSCNFPGANFENVVQYNCPLPHHFQTKNPMGTVRQISEALFFEAFAETGPDLDRILKATGYHVTK